MLVIPPGPASLATPVPPAWLSLTVVFVSVNGPRLLIPPPAPWAKGRSPLMQVIVMSGGHGSPESIAVVGSALLPVMTLFAIETVAPGAKFAAGWTEIPPPSALALPRSEERRVGKESRSRRGADGSSTERTHDR